MVNYGTVSLHAGVKFISTTTSSKLGTSGHVRGCIPRKNGSSSLCKPVCTLKTGYKTEKGSF